MGSGKTTVGRILAQRLGWEFADLDHRVEARDGRTVPQIFAQSGEAAFRTAEADALEELLRFQHVVIALGGGAPGTPRIRELLAHAPETVVIHLQAPFPVLYDRCTAQALDTNATERPLLGDSEAAQARYESRHPLYAAIADHTADAGVPTPEAVIDEILRALGR